jgi:hypothetical protein
VLEGPVDPKIEIPVRNRKRWIQQGNWKGGSREIKNDPVSGSRPEG